MADIATINAARGNPGLQRVEQTIVPQEAQNATPAPAEAPQQPAPTDAFVVTLSAEAQLRQDGESAPPPPAPPVESSSPSPTEELAAPPSNASAPEDFNVSPTPQELNTQPPQTPADLAGLRGRPKEEARVPASTLNIFA